jgi:DNA-binding LytR/AlgR family response regulator
VQHDKKRYIMNNNLEQIEEMLDPLHFFRLTRRYMANIKAIGEVHKYFNSRLKITLIPGVEDDVLVSRMKVPEFMKWLGG